MHDLVPRHIRYSYLALIPSHPDLIPSIQHEPDDEPSQHDSYDLRYILDSNATKTWLANHTIGH